MGCEKYKQIELKLSKETFANYEKWWEYYKIDLKKIKVLINNHAGEKV